MLSWSSHQDGTPADVDALASGDGDAGLPHGALLMAFAEAIAQWDDDALTVARDALVGAAGEAFMVDAAAVAANFEMMTRVADGTGAQHAPEVQADREALAARLGMVERP
ncbi:MAG: hypothetical protein RL238_461 [Actinomycetota bacterium]|jgi:hypothetical protein